MSLYFLPLNRHTKVKCKARKNQWTLLVYKLNSWSNNSRIRHHVQFLLFTTKAQDADCVIHSIVYCCIPYCTNSVEYLSNHMTTWWDSENWQHTHITAYFKIHNAMCGFSTISPSKALKSEFSRLLYPTCKTNYKSSRCLGRKQSPSAPHTTGGARILRQSNTLSDCLSEFSDPNKIPKMPAASQIVIILLLGTSSFTWPTFSTVLLIDGHP